MNKKFDLIRSLMAIIVVFLLFSTTGCALFSKKETGEKNVNPPKQTTQNSQQTPEQSSQQVEDKEFVEKIKKEKGVKNALAYTQNNVAVAVIIAEKSMSKEAVNKLANKYSKELKEKYKNQKVVVQALVNDKDWININLD